MNRKTKVVESPCTKFLKWSTLEDEDGKIVNGVWQYYDKDLGEKGEKVNIELPFKFALISDELVTIKGFSKAKQCGIWSNEVRKPEQILTVRDKDGIIAEFSLKEYKNNKAILKEAGASYCKSIYIAVNGENGWEMMNIQAKSSVLTGGADPENMTEDDKQDGWFGFTKYNKGKLLSNMINVDSYKLRRNGKVRFSVPTFTIGEVISPENIDALEKLNDELEDYLKFYFNRPKDTTESTEQEEVAVDSESEDDFVK